SHIALFVHGALLYANLGDDVTLRCHYDLKFNHLYWYRQVAGEQPKLISSFYKHSPSSNRFHNQFEDNQRFSLQTGEGYYHLKISNIQDSDSSMYYCGHENITGIKFDEGMLLHYQYRWSILQQPESESVQPGGSATLSCTVLAGATDGKHSVYWFKKDSGSPRLGIMYSHANSSSQCSDTPESRCPEQRCMYKLAKRNVSLSDAGMYYCAVASCGEILFGKGTRLDVGGEQHLKLFFPSSADFACSLSLYCFLFSQRAITTLSLSWCTVWFQLWLQMPSLMSYFLQSEDLNAMQYVALDFKKKQSTSRRQKITEEETVYSGVKLSELE
uniref:Ig-like domain-containing protein n=1 Tax=Stegastes partitus TaxID=144197 RepID=A0A3B5A7N0_9TELE